MKNFFLTISIITTFSLTAFSQEVQEAKVENQIQDTTYSYAYITAYWKVLPKRLKVDVDLGDTPEQLKAGEEYSKILSGKKSFAAVLNYMTGNGFELIQTLALTSSDGTSGFIFIMKKKEK